MGMLAKLEAEALVRKLGTPLFINSGHQWFELTIKQLLMTYFCSFGI